MLACMIIFPTCSVFDFLRTSFLHFFGVLWPLSGLSFRLFFGLFWLPFAGLDQFFESGLFDRLIEEKKNTCVETQEHALKKHALS